MIQVFSVFKNVVSQNFLPLATWDKNSRSQPWIPYPFDVELFLLLLQNSGIGYQYLTYWDWVSISDVGPNFWHWVVAEILAAHTPV